MWYYIVFHSFLCFKICWRFSFAEISSLNSWNDLNKFVQKCNSTSFVRVVFSIMSLDDIILSMLISLLLEWRARKFAFYLKRKGDWLRVFGRDFQMFFLDWKFHWFGNWNWLSEWASRVERYIIKVRISDNFIGIWCGGGNMIEIAILFIKVTCADVYVPSVRNGLQIAIHSLLR